MALMSQFRIHMSNALNAGDGIFYQTRRNAKTLTFYFLAEIRRVWFQTDGKMCGQGSCALNMCFEKSA